MGRHKEMSPFGGDSEKTGQMRVTKDCERLKETTVFVAKQEQTKLQQLLLGASALLVLFGLSLFVSLVIFCFLPNELTLEFLAFCFLLSILSIILGIAIASNCAVPCNAGFAFFKNPFTLIMSSNFNDVCLRHYLILSAFALLHCSLNMASADIELDTVHGKHLEGKDNGGSYIHVVSTVFFILLAALSLIICCKRKVTILTTAAVLNVVGLVLSIKLFMVSENVRTMGDFINGLTYKRSEKLLNIVKHDSDPSFPPLWLVISYLIKVSPVPISMTFCLTNVIVVFF